MTNDTLIGIGGLILGFVGIVVTVVATIWTVRDSRRQRSEREKAVIVAHSVVDRAYGLLVGIKPSISQLGEAHEKAVNDGLAAINEQRESLKEL